jgi:dipeptidyl aminopeptidase/acylaminoacyl peptidase
MYEPSERPDRMPKRRFSAVLAAALLAAVGLGAGIAAPAWAAGPPAKAVPSGQSLAVFPDPEPKGVTAALEQIQQALFVDEQKTIALQFELDNGCCVHMQFVNYASGHDLIPGYVFTPVHMAGSKRYPAVIVLHGGFHMHLDVEWFPLIRGLVDRGYVVMFPEYRGSQGYGPEIYANDYGHTDVADTLAAGRYIASKPFVDPGRVGILGESRGGMVTLLAIEQAPRQFKVAVDVVGLADFIAYMSYKPEYRRQEVASEKGFGGKMPFDDLQEYMDVSPVNHVDRIQAPLLVLATTGDEIAPLELHSGRLIQLLKADHKVFDSHIYDNAPGGHVFLHGDTPERADAYRRIFDWLGRYLQ